MPDEVRFQPESRAEWRAWLEANHDKASGVWLVSWRRKSGRQRTVSYEDAIEEALCFGWVDSVGGHIDDERGMLRFSPRKPGSIWARSNKERIARLEAAGLMTEAGRRVVEAARADGSWTTLDAVEDMIVPDDLAEALAARRGARAVFDAWPPSTRKIILAWLVTAKRPATRAARIEETAAAAGAGMLPGPLRPRQ